MGGVVSPDGVDDSIPDGLPHCFRDIQFFHTLTLYVYPRQAHQIRNRSK